MAIFKALQIPNQALIKIINELLQLHLSENQNNWGIVPIPILHVNSWSYLEDSANHYQLWSACRAAHNNRF